MNDKISNMAPVNAFRNQFEFKQQRMLQQQINALFSKRYDLISRLRKDDTQHCAMLNEDWWNAERQAEVGEKRKARALLS